MLEQEEEIAQVGVEKEPYPPIYAFIYHKNVNTYSSDNQD